MANHNKSMTKLLRQRVQKHPDGTKEYWRDVPGYRGYYRVSDRGRVKSVTRVVLAGGKPRTYRSRVLNPVVDSGGRLNVFLSVRGRKLRRVFVHRLVLLAFIGPCPPGMICRHFPDRDPANCNLVNIQWGTYKENEQDKIVHGTNVRGTPRGQHYNIGERNGSAKVTETVVRQALGLHARGYTQAEISCKLAISPGIVGAIVNRRKWKHVNPSS